MWRNRWILLSILFTFRFELFSQTEVLFSHQGGFYDEPFVLYLGSNDWGCQIYYTIDGNTPTVSSFLYDEPLLLDEDLYSTSDIYTLPIAPVYEPYVPESVRHAIVIRAAAFDDEGNRVSDVVTQTYLIRSLGCDQQGMAVVSICCDSLSLFDYNTGIMVPGVLFDPEQPETTGNYFQRGREWERLANMEFYEQDNSGINQQCGLRMHGNRARKAAAKGMKAYAREEYGKKRFKHRFFETTPIHSFNHLVLKPFSTLWPYSGLQDYVANCMALQLGLEAPSSRPVSLYLNGEYWGVYFLQEKMDDHYLEDHYSVETEQCNIVSGNGVDGFSGVWNLEVESGESSGFEQLMDWLEEAELSDSANYAYLSSVVDIDNYIDYQIMETFIANTDWPANNMRCWQTNGSKWRFMFYDGDAALLDKNFDVFENACYVRDDRWYTGGRSTLLFRRLLENDDFRNRFDARVNELCNSILRYDSVAPYLDDVVDAMRFEIPNQTARFGYPESIGYWDWSVSLVRDFIRARVDAYLEAYDSFELFKSHDYSQHTDDFIVYPNPVGNVVSIMMLDGRSRVTDIVLCDMLGRVYLNDKAYISACEPLVLPIDLRPGVYVLRIGAKSHKIIRY